MFCYNIKLQIKRHLRGYIFTWNSHFSARSGNPAFIIDKALVGREDLLSAVCAKMPRPQLPALVAHRVPVATRSGPAPSETSTATVSPALMSPARNLPPAGIPPRSKPHPWGHRYTSLISSLASDESQEHE